MVLGLTCFGLACSPKNDDDDPSLLLPGSSTWPISPPFASARWSKCRSAFTPHIMAEARSTRFVQPQCRSNMGLKLSVTDRLAFCPAQKTDRDSFAYPRHKPHTRSLSLVLAAYRRRLPLRAPGSQRRLSTPKVVIVCVDAATTTRRSDYTRSAKSR